MRLFAKNVRTFLLALALGVSVWVSAVSAADPNEVRAYPNPIPLEVVGQDPSLVLTSEIPSTVEVTYARPARSGNRSQPDEDAIRATLDLSGLSAGEHIQPIQLTISERPYQLILANPTTVTVNLESLASQTFPLVLSLSGSPPRVTRQGMRPWISRKSPFRAPNSIVRQAARARVLINLDGVRETIDELLADRGCGCRKHSSCRD